MLTIWLNFIVCALVILYAGSRLSQYGDIIAEKTGMGRAWIGVVLLASITSLPELANNISSIVYVNSPDLALGDLFGSCLFNILILAFLDLIYGPGPILRGADQGHILSAGLSMILLGTAAIGIAVSSRLVMPSIFNVGAFSLLIAAIYLIGQRMIFRFEKRKQAEFLKERTLKYEKVPFRDALLRFTLFALVVVAAGWWLAEIGAQISAATAWSKTFVGSIFLAAATSLPEIVVSAFALRLGAIDMAVGNLFGSNVFNIFIIFIDDLFYRPGAILASVSQNHIYTALFAIVLTCIAVVGLIFRSEKKVFRGLSWDSIAIILVYLMSVYILFQINGL